MTCSFSFIRLWNYLNIYFLKPFDAVNDTITSDLLLKLKWQKDYLEIGSGDGMFSYVMHGNSFPIWFDRYLNVNLKSKNIFKIKNKNHLKFPKFKKRKFKIHPKLSIDARPHHVGFIKKIKFSKSARYSKYENLNVPKNSQDLIFFYTPHGLKSYSVALKEATECLKKNGKLLVLLFLDNVNENFISYKLQKKLNGKFKTFFKIMDNGRYHETNKISKKFNSWNKLFEKNKLIISNYYTGLSPIAWRIYDIQTRPFLKVLIIFFSSFPLFLRTFFKFLWMISFFPFLCLTYIFCSNISPHYLNKNCYIVFELKKNEKIIKKIKNNRTRSFTYL